MISPPKHVFVFFIMPHSAFDNCAFINCDYLNLLCRYFVYIFNYVNILIFNFKYKSYINLSILPLDLEV